jgi:tetratricopeptide (TPR) repeat protein
VPYNRPMTARFAALCSAVLLAAALAGPVDRARAQAQAPAPAPGAAEPDKAPRETKADRGRSIDFLFEALKAAPDAETAKLVESRIWALWLASGSDTADLLMSRVKQAAEEKDVDLAIRLLDAIIELKPDYTEAWNRRATMYFTKKDYGHALADIAQALAREPRHFGALTGLGMILQEMGEDKRALEAFRRALEIDPHLQKIPEFVKALTDKVEGRDI